MGIRMTVAEARRMGIAVPAGNRLSRIPRGLVSATPQDIFVSAAILRYGSRVCPEYRPIDGRKYRIDLAFPIERLAVEIDGWQHHGKTLGAFRNDRVRQNALTIAGWRILRFPAGDVHANLSGIFASIDDALKVYENKQ